MAFQHFQDFHDKLRLQNPKRSFRLHHIGRPGVIIPVGHRLSINVQHHCLVESISCAAALLNISRHTAVAQNFFLLILGSSEEIGASEVSRKGDTMVVKFNMFLDAGFLQSIVGTASLEDASLL